MLQAPRQLCQESFHDAPPERSTTTAHPRGNVSCSFESAAPRLNPAEGACVIKESGAGLTVPPEDADALAAAVLKVYRATPEERAEMGRRGRAYFQEHFEREKLLDQLEGWMEELVGKGA